MNLYTQLIIDLSKNPANRRALPDANCSASGANVTCGDRVRMYAKMLRQAQHDILADCSFEGEGCAISTAAASLITEEAKGKTATEISAWDSLKIFELLGTELGPSRIKCGLLPLETLQSALTHTANASSLQRGREEKPFQQSSFELPK